MALPASGAISLNQVNVELGKLATSAITLNDTAVRGLAGVASGTISMSNLLGKSAGLFATISSLTFSSGGGFYSREYTEGGIAVDSSGNIHVVGTTGANMYVAKISNTGTILWQKSCSIPFRSLYGTSCDLDSSGDLYVGGRDGSSSWILLKFNSSGTLLFNKIGSTVYTGGVADVAVVGPLNFVMWAGTVGSESYGGNDAQIYNSPFDGSTFYGNNGGAGGIEAEESRKITFNSATPTRAQFLFCDPYYNTGSTWNTLSFYASGSQILLSQVITKRYQDVYLTGIDGDASFTYVCGLTRPSGNAFIAKHGSTDSNGGITWQKEFAGAGFKALVLSGGHLYAAGESSGRGFLVKMDLSGNLVWQRFVGSASSSNIANIRVIGDKIYGVGMAAGLGLVFIMSTDAPLATKGSYSISAGNLTLSNSTQGISARRSGGVIIGMGITDYSTTVGTGSLSTVLS
jgi:hypothetical protein